MPGEPTIKRAVAFVDGQNLYRSAKSAFGYHYPNYDVHALATSICVRQGWELRQVRFYTGIPDVTDNPFWNHFWTAKFAQMGRQGVHVFWRLLRYRNELVRLPDGREVSVLVGREKGVDVRLALDVIRLAHRQEYDVALIFSQDQDLSEVGDELRVIGQEQARWIKAACAFPVSLVVPKPRGINGTDWIKIDRATYDACLDSRDYRPKPPNAKVGVTSMLYFAYGSNMDWEQITGPDRCPKAKFSFKAILPNYKLEFTHQRIENRGGAADVVQCAGEAVWGVVYQLEESDKSGLYRSEGYQPGRAHNSYAPSTVTVFRNGNMEEPVEATTFTVCRKLPPHQKPSREYLDHILAGAKHWGLPDDYQAMLKRFEVRE